MQNLSKKKCNNSFEKLSSRTNKTMIFCKRMGDTATLDNLCISQRFCPDKDKYVETNQEINCKYFE